MHPPLPLLPLRHGTVHHSTGEGVKTVPKVGLMQSGEEEKEMEAEVKKIMGKELKEM